MTETQRNDLEYLESIEFPSPEEWAELQTLCDLALEERLQNLKTRQEGVPA